MKVRKSTSAPKRTFLPALRGVFGDWVYYSCLMPMADVASRVGFAGKVVGKSERYSEWIQREIKDGRAKEIAQYLTSEDQRFFNSLVVAIHGGDPAWHGFGDFRPETDDIRLQSVPEDVEAGVGFLSFDGTEKIFALDGQHRLAGIQEALVEHPELGREDVSLIVVGHEATKAGRERTRRLFTTLNKTAVPVSKGEIIALDENDVMAIVTRYIVEDSKYLAGGRIKFVANENLEAEADELTTIGNLYDVLSIIFSAVKNVKPRDLRFRRFEQKAVDEYKAVADQFFSSLGVAIVPLGEFFSSPVEDGPKIVARQRYRGGGNVVFRPVGLRVLAEVAGVMIRNGFTVKDAVHKLGKLPMELSGSPYRDVLWLPTGRMNPAGRSVCRRLLLWMLGFEKKEGDLMKRYAKLLDKDPSTVQLPKRIK